MNPYEMTFIVRPDLDEEQIRAATDRLVNRIQSTGGEIIATYPWNPPRRRMTYPIREFGDGYYVTTTFNFPPQGLTELERTLRLSDEIIRFLIVQATQLQIQQSQQRAQQYAARLAGAQQAPQGEPAPQPQAAPQQQVAVETQAAPQPVAAAPEPVATDPEAVAAAPEAEAPTADASETTTDTVQAEAEVETPEAVTAGETQE